MARDDDDVFAPRAAAAVKHAIGEPLDAVSIEDLESRVGLLRAEIERIEAAIVQKRASRAAAACFFKSSPNS